MIQPQPWSRRIPFKVDVAGVIEVMGASLYSRATTPVRELIQNAHDAIVRRRTGDLAYKGRIDVRQDAAAGTLAFADDGIGLSADEAERYLGTLGIGITGLLKRAARGGVATGADAEVLIGQFGVGLFSAFLLAGRVVVETKKADGSPAVRWEAGPGTDIELSSCGRADVGTVVTLHLKPEHLGLARDEGPLVEAVKAYADFLPVPVFVNGGAARANLGTATWFDPTPDREAIELELAEFFGESPLDVIPVRVDGSGGPGAAVSVVGALYVTPNRTPGFSGEAVVTATVRRMVVSRDVRGLLPPWASFLRGVLELNGCAPTASREDLVRDDAFAAAAGLLEGLLLDHFERLAGSDPARLAGVLAWHRYAFAGAALTHPRVRSLLRRTYPFGTTQGPLTFDQILERSGADPLFEANASHVLWFNVDRRQERWAEAVFAGQAAPCVHTVRTFEESLLAALAADATAAQSGGVERVDLRAASASSPQFARSVLGVTDMAEADDPWQQFLASTGAAVFVASFDPATPVMAFLNERRELIATFDEIKKGGQVPAGFQRLIDAHLSAGGATKGNEVLLNRRHPLVGRALSQKTAHPLASVLRLLVVNALSTAGATLPPEARKRQGEDLDWIADVLWAKSGE